MATTPIVNIYHPDNATLAQDVPTLGAMADSVETAMLNLPRKFADFTALEAWTPANGALAFVQADGRTYQRESNTWRPIQARHVFDNAAGRAYFSTNDNGTGDTLLGFSPPDETSMPMAMWLTVDGSNALRVYKNGDLVSFGAISQNDDTGWVNCTRASGISVQGSREPQVRRHLGRVYFQWGHSGSGIPASTGGIHTFTVPVGFRPSIYKYFRIAGNGATTDAHCVVSSNGVVSISTTAIVGNYYMYDNVSYFLD